MIPRPIAALLLALKLLIALFAVLVAMNLIALVSASGDVQRQVALGVVSVLFFYALLWHRAVKQLLMIGWWMTALAYVIVALGLAWSAIDIWVHYAGNLGYAIGTTVMQCVLLVAVGWSFVKQWVPRRSHFGKGEAEG